MRRCSSGIFALFMVGCLVATAGTASAYDDKTVEKAEKEILKTGDELLKTAQMVGALEHYDLTATYNGVSIFTAYSELKLNYTALLWEFMDFNNYTIYPPDEAYALAVQMKEEAEGIKDVAEETLDGAGYSKGTTHKGKALVIGGLWISKFTTAFIAAFDGYSPTVAENTLFKGKYEPSGYDIIVLDEPCLWFAGRTSFRNLKRLERVLDSGEVGVIFMLGAMSPNPYHRDYGVFSMIFPNGFNDTVYDFGFNYTLRTNTSAPSEFENLSSTWDLSDWGAWTFTLPPNLQNQEVILNLEWPTYRHPWNSPRIYGRPVAIAFTSGDAKLIASGLRSYLVRPWEPPYEREPVEWLYESPDYEEFLTASLEHVAP